MKMNDEFTLHLVVRLFDSPSMYGDPCWADDLRLSFNVSSRNRKIVEFTFLNSEKAGDPIGIFVFLSWWFFQLNNGNSIYRYAETGERSIHSSRSLRRDDRISHIEVARHVARTVWFTPLLGRRQTSLIRSIRDYLVDTDDLVEEFLLVLVPVDSVTCWWHVTALKCTSIELRRTYSLTMTILSSGHWLVNERDEVLLFFSKFIWDT